MSATENTPSVPPLPLSRLRFVTHVGWNLLATLGTLGSTFLSNVVLANLLGRSPFGAYAMMLSTIHAIVGLATLGLGYAATRFTAEWRNSDPDRAGRMIGLTGRLAMVAGTVAAVLFFALAGVIADRVFATPSLAAPLRWASPAVFCLVVNGFQTGALAGLERFDRLGLAGLLGGTVYFLLCVGGGLVGGANGAVAGVALSAALQAVLLRWLLVRSVRDAGLTVTSAAWTTEREVFLHWVVPNLMGGLSSVPALWAAQAALARTSGGYSQLGVYVAALNLAMMVVLVPTVVNGVGIAVLNNARHADGGRRFEQVYSVNLRVTFLCAGAAAGLFGLLSARLLGLYGADFRAYEVVLKVLLVAAVAESLTIALSQRVQSQSRVWRALALVNIPRDLAIPLLAWWWAPSLGALGVAWAYLCGRLIGLAGTAVCGWLPRREARRVAAA